MRPTGDLLQMDTLIYFDEIVPQDRIDELPDEDVEITERELSIAKQLVESLATEWEPDQYKDEYREKVLAMIEQKAAGEEVAVQPAPRRPRRCPTSWRAEGEPRRRQGRDEAPPPKARRRRPAQRSRAGQAQGAGQERVGPAVAIRSPAIRLRRSDTSEPGIRRRRRGKGFDYLNPDGTRVDDPEILGRIHELVIPPAWEDVWISPYPGGHIQATGVDARGRKQYLYHPKWRARRDQEKFDDMIALRAGAAVAARARRRATSRGDGR